MNRWRGIIEEYRKFLPVTEKTPIISLGEGNTPLIRAARLAKAIAPGVDLTEPAFPEWADFLDEKYGPEVR